MKMIFKRGVIEIYECSEIYGVEFYVYGVTLSGEPRVVASIGMAMETAECAY